MIAAVKLIRGRIRYGVAPLSAQEMAEVKQRVAEANIESEK